VRFKSEDERAEMNVSIAAELGIDPDRTGDALMVEMVNRPYASAFEAYAVKHPDVLCLSADLTSSCEIDGFRDRHPDQFLSLGMAEQNMMSFAGGLGLAGYRPFLHSFGVFLYRRPYDQLMASVAYPRRKVRLMGFLPGITTPGGMTHQAIEDVAVMRSIPNMSILETGDATEVESICEAADSIDGPVYCRVLRGSVPRLFASPIKVGEMRELATGRGRSGGHFRHCHGRSAPCPRRALQCRGLDPPSAHSHHQAVQRAGPA
jgi:transketolase